MGPKNGGQKPKSKPKIEIFNLGLQKFWRHFCQILAKLWPKWVQIFLEALIKNPSKLVFQELSLLILEK